jgi:hypothetical protein
MPRPQFSLKTLLWLMAVVAAFYAGSRFERERQRRATRATPLTGPIVEVATIEFDAIDRVNALLEEHGIKSFIEGSIVYGVSVPSDQKSRALSLIRADAADRRYWVQLE